MSNTTTPNQQALTRTEAKKEFLEFVPFGSENKIKLSVTLVKNYLAVPTKSGRYPTERDCMRFMMLCAAKGLNPWEGDAFLVGYDTSTPNGPMAQFSQITAHQAFLKRAEPHPEYDGMKSGIILLLEDNKTEDREGDFHLPDEQVVGGWATVFFKNRKFPITRRLRLSRFNTGYAEWKKDPAGMIVKCAEADALRSSFPTKLGGLYTREENQPAIEINSTLVETQAALPPPAPEPPPVPPGTDGKDLDDIPMGNAPTTEPAPTTPPPAAAPTAPPARVMTAREQLSDFVLRECLCSFTDFQKWASGTGNLPNADSLTSFDEVPEDIAKRLLRAKAGLSRGVKQAAGKE